MRYRFDRFEIDTEHYALSADGAAVHVEPLVFDLIVFLVERAGQVVSREAIIEHVWEDRIVSDATVASCIKSARRALGDSGEQQTYIRTVRSRGFQLVAAIDSRPGVIEASVLPRAEPTPPVGDIQPSQTATPPRIAFSHRRGSRCCRCSRSGRVRSSP